MKCFAKLGVAAAVSMMLTAPAVQAQTIGVAIANFNDNFLTILRNAITDKAKAMPGVKLQFEDAQTDIGRQINQVQNFISSKVDAIIVNPADTAATDKITAMVTAAGIPLVYVNRAPNRKEVPPKVAVVASNHITSGRFEMEELCKQMHNEGNLVILMAELSANHTIERTAGYKEVIKDKCPKVKILDEQTANSQRTQAIDRMTNWLSKGWKIDGVVANDDEMAVGAIQAIRSAGIPAGKIKVAGIDATPDGLAEMKKGWMHANVFQNAKGQGEGALDAAYKLIKGEKVESYIWIPYEPVSLQNYTNYMKKN